MREITYREAINEAMDIELSKNHNLYILGEDIGIYGGVFKATKGLYEKYGPDRIIDTPISEQGVTGLSIGAALCGLTIICDLMLSDLLYLPMDQIVNQGAKLRYMFGGNFKLPLVIRTATGARAGFAAQHSQTLYEILAHIPGLITIAPSDPKDAKGLLLSSLRCNNMVLFFEHKTLYNEKGEVPEEDYQIPIGKGEIKREGKDLTIFATSLMVSRVLKIVDDIYDKKGIDIEVIDPRTLNPLDKELIINSVKKTNKLIVVDESPKTGGYASEIISVVNEEAFDYLDHSIIRVTSKDTPVPFCIHLEEEYLPSEREIIEAINILSP